MNMPLRCLQNLGWDTSQRLTEYRCNNLYFSMYQPCLLTQLLLFPSLFSNLFRLFLLFVYQNVVRSSSLWLQEQQYRPWRLRSLKLQPLTPVPRYRAVMSETLWICDRLWEIKLNLLVHKSLFLCLANLSCMYIIKIMWTGLNVIV